MHSNFSRGQEAETDEILSERVVVKSENDPETWTVHSEKHGDEKVFFTGSNAQQRALEYAHFKYGLKTSAR